MAAAVGTVASGVGLVSFAIDIVSAALKLKSLVSDIISAPADLLDMIEEIKDLNEVLGDLDPTSPGTISIGVDDRVVTKCKNRCVKAAGVLLTAVKELEGEVKRKRFVGSTKVVLKKEALARLRSKITTAKDLLLLSMQSYST
jgi:hypothetical protein